MKQQSFVLRGDIVQSSSPENLSVNRDGFLVCENGVSAGVYQQLPERYHGLVMHDYQNHLVIPGLIDLHTHASQFALRGLGLDLELLDWLNTYTFAEEVKYARLAYAENAYRGFVDNLVEGATTRAAVFATVHLEATLLLMDLLEGSGLKTVVGKVNMDRNGLAGLVERDALSSLETTRQWLSAVGERAYEHTRPILTPRFIPSCSDELMDGLSNLQREFSLPVQSHLSENSDEIAWVHRLRPDAATYAQAYLNSGLFGGAKCPTIMAHCVHSGTTEIDLLKERGVWVAHCPISNTCLSSGIAPARVFLDRGLLMGLGSDVSGGYSTSMLHVVAEAIKVSKLRRFITQGSPGEALQDLDACRNLEREGADALTGDDEERTLCRPLTLPEAFYLATRGGGSFFGSVGAFEPGFEFDAVVLQDRDLSNCGNLSPEERLERLVYLDGNNRVCAKYVGGRQLFSSGDIS